MHGASDSPNKWNRGYLLHCATIRKIGVDYLCLFYYICKLMLSAMLAESENFNMTPRIEFETQNVEMPDLDWREVRNWINAVAQSHGCTVHRLSYLFMDDAGILESNIQALGHDYYTDIITFDYSRDGRLCGEIHISLDTVRSNAEGLGQPYSRELMRVIIHGVLHLVGINDKGPGEREIMEAAENAALNMWPPSLLL